MIVLLRVGEEAFEASTCDFEGPEAVLLVRSCAEVERFG